MQSNHWKIESTDDLSEALENAPDQLDKIFASVLESDNFNKIVTDNATVGFLAHLFSDEVIKQILPEVAKDKNQTFYTDKLFNEIVKPDCLQKILHDADDLSSLVSYFPSHTDDLFNIAIRPPYSEMTFKDLHSLAVIAKAFPAHRNELFKLAIQPSYFTQIVNNSFDIGYFIKTFPEFRSTILNLVLEPGHYARLIKDEEDLEIVRKTFPIYARLFSLDVNKTVNDFEQIMPDRVKKIHPDTIKVDNEFNEITESERLKKIIQDADDIKKLVSYFPTHALDICNIVTHPPYADITFQDVYSLRTVVETFPQFNFIILNGMLESEKYEDLVASHEDAMTIGKFFPAYVNCFCEDAEITARLVNEELKKNPMAAKGSAGGMFKDILPEKIGRYIGSFFTPDSTTEVKMTNKGAYVESKKEKEFRFENGDQSSENETPDEGSKNRP